MRWRRTELDLENRILCGRCREEDSPITVERRALFFAEGMRDSRCGWRCGSRWVPLGQGRGGQTGRQLQFSLHSGDERTEAGCLVLPYRDRAREVGGYVRVTLANACCNGKGGNLTGHIATNRRPNRGDRLAVNSECAGEVERCCDIC
jgi:hypothetical protein